MTNDSLLEKTIAAAKEVSIDNGITVVLKLESIHSFPNCLW